MTIQQKIEKIREIVIMKNNPECKSYEEALEKEAGNMDCLFTNFCHHEVYWDMEKSQLYANEDIIDKSKYQILGLPLTLERVLVTLVDEWKNINHDLKHNGVQYQAPKYQYNNLTGEFIIYTMNSLGYVQYINWQPNKILEDQSEETIEKIYNILF